MKIWHNTDEDYSAIGNVEKMYNAITCVKGPEGNFDNSYLTFRSGVAFLFGVIEVRDLQRICRIKPVISTVKMFF